MKKLSRLFGMFSLCILSSCDLIEHREYHDPGLKLRAEDYKTITKEPVSPQVIPEFKPQPKALKPKPVLTPEMKKPVSLIIQDNVPLKEILLELSRQAGVGLALSPGISGKAEGITYSAQKQPFIEVIRDLCELTGLRFQITNNLIKIEMDEPYLVTYDLHTVSQVRKNDNKSSISTDIFTVLQDKQNRADNGSDTVLQGNTLTDFWSELEQNLMMILSQKDGTLKKGTPSLDYTIHKQGGLITAKGTAQQHKQLYDYFNQLARATATQVIIEAKIIEVTLNNQYKTGINWSQLGGSFNFSAALGSTTTPGPYKKSTLSSRDLVTFAFQHEDFSSVLNMIKKFGTVRALSNPRLTVMNNQPAMLKVATNEVFFMVDFERVFAGNDKPDTENISSQIMTVPIGMLLVVQPSVNLETGDIAMTLRPTISRVEKFVDDPAVAIKSANTVTSKIPVVQVREMDSVLRLKSGQVVVLGGLMEDRAENSSASVPVVDSVPVLGELGRGKDDDRKVNELVIFLTAHIAEEPIIAPADERLYNTYTEDPRPLAL
ncbi:Type II and III secretion system protein [Candidatus Bealeia paramacronuclearis]|uniref:Type II and III secretion system protein n=1 Tax=Candidatus Bealeia paramacronuclearis TaxID=1921001 RepID=A0ABZ2C5G1_9PROT|nr:Type II and III secretion system protein [Candidatus Bealeia paramacronuclearis]